MPTQPRDSQQDAVIQEFRHLKTLLKRDLLGLHRTRIGPALPHITKAQLIGALLADQFGKAQADAAIHQTSWQEWPTAR
jgi:hypothetical protein